MVSAFQLKKRNKHVSKNCLGTRAVPGSQSGKEKVLAANLSVISVIQEEVAHISPFMDLHQKIISKS